MQVFGFGVWAFGVENLAKTLQHQDWPKSAMTNQTHDMDDHGDDMTRSCRHLSQCGVSHVMKHVQEKK